MNDVWNLPFRQREKLLALAIADCANDDGIAWPGQHYLAKKTGMSRSTISVGIKELKKSGWCQIENHSEFGKGKKVNVYIIQNTPKVHIVDNRQKRTKSPQSGRFTKSPQPGHAKVHNPDTKSPYPGHETPLEPPLKENHHIYIETPEDEKKFNPTSFRPTWIPNKYWKEFLSNRKFEKLQNTELALTTITNSLRKGVDAGYPIEICIGEYVSSSWQRFDHTWLNKNGDKNGNHKRSSTGYSDAKTKDWTK